MSLAYPAQGRHSTALSLAEYCCAVDRAEGRGGGAPAAIGAKRTGSLRALTNRTQSYSHCICLAVSVCASRETAGLERALCEPSGEVDFRYEPDILMKKVLVTTKTSATNEALKVTCSVSVPQRAIVCAAITCALARKMLMRLAMAGAKFAGRRRTA